MKTKEELMAFAEGYRNGLVNDRAFYGTDLSGVEDWVEWGDYYINIFGSYYSVRLNDDKQALSVDAYPHSWTGDMPDPIHSFDLIGETA